MTQASLSPDLSGALGATPVVGDAPARSSAPSEGALWLIALTSSALVVAAVLLLALLLNNVVTDASLGGFVAGIGIVIAALGLGGVTYSVVTARRAGYIVDPVQASTPASVLPEGMRVVPALPPDLGRRKRQQLEAERSARARQAKAIAAVTTADTTITNRTRPGAPAAHPSRRSARPRPTPRPARRPAARPLPAGATRPAQPAPRSAPVATRPTPADRPAPAPTRAAPSPVRSVAPPPRRVQGRVRPAITMPQARAHQPRPAAWPAHVPVVRLPAPPMRPRTQVASFQVNAAKVRAAAPIRRSW